MYDRFYTQTNVSDVYEFTEADDSFSEAYDSLSREPIIITSNLGMIWFSLDHYHSQVDLGMILIGPIKKDKTYLFW